MLAGIRKGAQNLFVKLLLALLVLSFVIWGIGDIFRGTSSQVAATVGDQEISYTELRQELEQSLRNVQQMYGSNITYQDLVNVGEVGRALNRLIDRRLFINRMQDRHFSVSDNVIKEEIAKQPVFQNDEGVFDKSIFASMVRRIGLTEKQYISRLRQQISMQLFLSQLAHEPFVSPFMVEQLFNYQFQTRDVEVVRVPSTIVDHVEEPSETQLVQFYNEQSKRFTVPELRSAIYIILDATKISGDVTLTDEQLQSYYDQHIDQYTVQPSRTIDQFLYDNESDALSTYEKLQKGEKISEGKMELGAITKDGLPENVQEEVFSLKIGGVSKPIQTALGWHVFVVRGEEEASTKSFASVKEQIRQELLVTKKADQFYEYVNHIEDDLASGVALEELSKQENIALHKVDNINQFGKAQDGHEISDMPEASVFVPLVFSLDQGVESSLTALSDNQTYVIAKVTEILPARTKPLDEVRGLARGLWKEHQTDKKLKEQTDQVIASIDSQTKSLEDVAKSKLYHHYASITLSRHEENSLSIGAGKDSKVSLPSSFVEAVFAAKVNDVTASYKLENGDYVFAKLTSVVLPNKEKQHKEYRMMEDGYKSRFIEDILQQYTAYLRSIYPVKINDAVVSRALNLNQ